MSRKSDPEKRSPGKKGPEKSEVDKGEALLPVTLVACAGPMVLHVGRIIMDQEASSEAMLTLFFVAAFGLSAMIGQKWAVRFAPAVFLLSGAPLVVYAVMGIAPAYWLVLLGLAWCIHELSSAGDIRDNLARRVNAAS